MKKILSLILSAILICSLFAVDVSTASAQSNNITQTFLERVKEDYDLVWYDEFKGDTLDTTKWDLDGQIIHRNGELQVYADSMEDGNMEFDGENAIIIPKIETRVQADGSVYKYTSADITTEHKQTWKYGYFEIRAKPSCGKNLVPAVWMLGYDFENYKKDKRENCNWPRSGEIDILERQSDNAVYSTLHHTKYGSNKSDHTATGAGSQSFDHKLNEEFHNYWLYWTDKYIIVGVDDTMHQIVDITTPDLAQSFRSYEHWLIINVALGMFSKPVDDSEVDEWKMYIDHVRVYQLNDDKLYDNYLPFSALDIMNNGNDPGYGKTVSTLKTESQLNFTMNDELEPGKYDVYAEINNVNTTASINGIETNKITQVDKGVSVGGQAYVGSVDLQDKSSFDISFSGSVKVKKLIFIKTDETKITPVVVNKDNCATVSDYFEVSTEDELLNASKRLLKNGTIKLLNDITLTKNVQLFDGQIIDLNGKTLTVNNGRVFVNGEKEAITVKNGKVLILDGNRFIFTKENNYNAKANLVDCDVTIDLNKSGSLFAHNYGNMFATCTDCTFTYTDRTSTKDIYRIASDNVTFNNCTFNLNNRNPVLAKKARNIAFNNCTVNNASTLFDSDSALASCNITIANTTFNNLGAISNYTENAQFVSVANNNVLLDSNGLEVTDFATMSGNFTMTCEHKFVDADCTTVKHCEYCNLIVGEAIGHKPVTTTTPTSCFESGSVKTTCETCGVTLSETKIPVLEHNYQKIKTVDPTCLNAGYHLWGCTECSMTQLRSYNGDGVNTKLRHTFDKSQTTVIPPTCTLGGYTLEYCTSCNDNIKTLYKLSIDHDYTETVKRDEGVVLYECKDCDESYTVELDECVHEPLDGASVVVNPTLSSQGYTVNVCKFCEQEFKTDFTLPLKETLLLELETLPSASIRLNEKTGLRFYTSVNQDEVERLKRSGCIVELGTLIAPHDHLLIEDLTFDLGVGKYVYVKYESEKFYSDGAGFSGIIGSLVNIKESTLENEESGNIARGFVARGYAKITDTAGETITVYADYDKTQSRSLGFVAYMLKNDKEEFSKDIYSAFTEKINYWAKVCASIFDPSREDVFN